jgi:4-hydroxy-tetrahydrodipicolinate reductase
VKLLLLGHGKTGSIVGEVARERGHEIRVLESGDNPGGRALTPDMLAKTDAVIDFTTPHAVVPNIEACLRGGARIVVGTTGWYAEMERVRKLAEASKGALLWASNFSLGVNFFFEAARTAAEALRHGYHGQIFERHHVHKKDAPSGTAVSLQRLVRDASEQELEVISFREGEVVGMHEFVLDCADDTVYVCHDAKSRRGFARGAVMAAEWVQGKQGFYDFREVFRQMG